MPDQSCDVASSVWSPLAIQVAMTMNFWANIYQINTLFNTGIFHWNFLLVLALKKFLIWHPRCSTGICHRNHIVSFSLVVVVETCIWITFKCLGVLFWILSYTLLCAQELTLNSRCHCGSISAERLDKEHVCFINLSPSIFFSNCFVEYSLWFRILWSLSTTEWCVFYFLFV